MNSSSLRRDKPAETVHEFRGKLLTTLQKFSECHTLKTGVDEIRRIMVNDITDSDRMNIFLHAISENNEHIKL